MPKKIDEELKARAVRLVNDHQGEYSSLTAAAAVVAKQLGVGKESVRRWVIQSQVDGGQRQGATTEEMAEICLGEHPHFRMPTLDERGTPVGIDVCRVVETGITPLINTGIAGRVPGTGQIGAGVVRAPLACFEAALAALVTEPAPRNG